MNCPCSSENEYAACCQPYHRGDAKAPTAEALMRSRYSAYVLGEIDYLVQTTHPATRSSNLQASYRATHESIHWVGLEVMGTFQGRANDKTGKVEFRATYLQDGQRAIHHEKSRFKRHAGAWHYLDGEVAEEVIG